MIEPGGNSACNGLDRLMRVQILLGFHMGRLEVENNFLDGTCEGIGRLVLVSEVHHAAVFISIPSVSKVGGQSAAGRALTSWPDTDPYLGVGVPDW
jgi:hypothetical protein